MKKKEEIKFEQPSEALLFANHYVMFVMAIIILILIAIGYFFLLKPKINDIQSIEEETNTSQIATLKNTELLDKVEELQEEYDHIKTSRQNDLTSLKDMIPEGPQMAELFVLAETLATEHGFRLDSIDIVDNKDAKEEPGAGFDPTTINQLTAEEIAAQAQEVGQTTINLKSLVVHLTLSKVTEEGGQSRVDRGSYLVPGQPEPNAYQDFKNYLTSLENNLRLMDLQTVTFSNLTTEDGSFNLSIITYYR